MLFPAMEAFAKGLSALAIMAFLLAVNPWVGLAAGVVLGAAYGYAAERFAQTQASNMIVSKLPKYILEAVAFGLIVVLEGVARPAAS